MELLEKVAYLKGLMSGLELEADKKETKVFNAILDVLDDLASTVTDMQEETDEMCELIDVLDEDLGEVEKVVYGDEDDDCDCCGDEDDEETYEITCPTCGETIYICESMLDEGEMQCPNCGQDLEFDLDIDEDHDHEDGCGCGCGCEVHE